MRTLYRAVPLNAAIRASNLIGTLFNGVRVPATNINFPSHPPKKKKKRMWNKAVSQDLPLFILQQTTKCQPWFALVSGSCVWNSRSVEKSCKSGRSRHVQVKHRTFRCSWLQKGQRWAGLRGRCRHAPWPWGSIIWLEMFHSWCMESWLSCLLTGLFHTREMGASWLEDEPPLGNLTLCNSSTVYQLRPGKWRR